MSVAPSAAELAKIRAFLDDQIPPGSVVHSIVVHDDTFDCVPFDQQPSVRAHRAHGIAVDATLKQPNIVLPATVRNPKAIGSSATRRSAATERCPANTVPIRRTPIDEITGYGTLDAYLRRPPPSLGTHEHRGAEYPGNRMLYGAGSTFNIWHPYVESPSEFSVSQLWLQSTNSSNQEESLEAGFVRYYGKNMQMFVFDTYNGYKTYCFNNQCDFVQTDSGVWVGVDWGSYSSYGGSQEDCPIQIVRGHSGPDAPDDNWWVAVGGTWLGYWPTGLFHDPGLLYFAVNTSYGGEVYQWNATRHTATAMGSGIWPNGGYGYAAYQANLQYVDIYGNWLPEDGLVTFGDGSTNCYNSQYFRSSDYYWGDYI
jgi:hypothetical protein